MSSEHPLLTRLRAAPRVSLAQWPSPVVDVALASGTQLAIKRDDLSGWGRGGAKARKIEHLLGAMRERRQDTLVAVAGNVTNVVFDILPACDAHGIDVRMFIIDDPVCAPRDREAMFAGVRDRVTLCSSSIASVAAHMLAAGARARLRGRRPLLVAPGLSHPSAIVGNAMGVVELADQCRAQGRALPRTIFITAATGSTIAGFLLAAHALELSGHPRIDFVGVQIYPGRITRWTWALLRWTELAIGSRWPVPHERIRIVDDALDAGFACFGADVVDCCDDVERAHGFRVDPIFGGKTYLAMQRRLREQSVAEPVLYWHCGYTPEWRELAQRVER